MGQKVHPIGFRIGVTQDHSSHWFAKPNQYASLLQEDLMIRSYLKEKCIEAGISNIQLYRKADRIEIELHAARPVVILGRKGTGLDSLRQGLQTKLNQTRQFAIQVVEIREPDIEAQLVAEFISSQLEKRIPFRRAMKQGLLRAKRAGVEGMKIQVSGRLNGAEIARSEWVREGRVPLQTLRADIDYCHHEANTIYGILGIKVWVFKELKDQF
uniref:Small ribosomal subunit protein uS3c n=1 Tax=Pyramimonas parkeae TaxID=36894 RepID=A0A1R7T0S9_9CHLO|nr:ribosomal protein S3 [Pyramimonas parkeae]